MFIKMNEIEQDCGSFTPMKITDLAQAIQENFDCSEDNADAVIVRTPDRDYVVVQSENDYFVAFGREMITFQNIPLVAWFIAKSRKNDRFKVETRTVRIEITIQ